MTQEVLSSFMRWMDGRDGGPRGKWLSRLMQRKMGEWLEGWLDRWMENGQMGNGKTDRWMDGWTDRWMDG